MRVEISGVTKQYETGSGGQVSALEDVSLTIGDAEFICLLGPSGCGKSTLLKLIAGLEQPSRGRITFDGGAGGAGGSPPGPSAERGFIFQDYALFPWLSVKDNIRFGLQMQGVSRKRQQEIVAEYLQLFDLTEAADRFPRQLSGGMSQRVAIARALCLKPRMLLMDEPFAALDALLRQRLQEEIARIWSRERITFILVTHDVEEAIYLADRILVMTPGPGRIKQAVQVGLARPRIRTDGDFVQLRSRLVELMEVDKAPAVRLPQSKQPHAAVHTAAGLGRI